MKRFLTVFLIVFIIFIGAGIYFVDKVTFLCPIEYKKDIVIRNDCRGDGHFGAKRNGNRRHNGVDLQAAMNAPVKAARLGIVVKAGFHKGAGYFANIAHAPGLVTKHFHLSRIFVKKGQLVRQGQIIGLVGKTGNSNHAKILPHLHFEVRRNDIPQDPMKGYIQ